MIINSDNTTASRLYLNQSVSEILYTAPPFLTATVSNYEGLFITVVSLITKITQGLVISVPLGR